jgi:hypothetical protein
MTTQHLILSLTDGGAAVASDIIPFEPVTTNHWNDYGQRVAFTAYPYKKPPYTALMPAYYCLFGNRYPWQLEASMEWK